MVKQGVERVRKFTIQRLRSEINGRFTRLHESDPKFGFLRDIDALCYGDEKRKLETNLYTFGQFFRSDGGGQALCEEILD